MTLIVLPDPPSDGQSADASDVNDQDNAIVAVVNGNLDDSNISSLSGTKLTAGTIPPTAFSPTSNLGWRALSGTFTSPVYNGNRSYSVTTSVDQSAVLSPGMRLQLTRTATAPTQCTSLNGTTQYYSKASPAGMTFTDDFVAGGWVKLTSYTGTQTIISRYNGTSGWALYVQNGQIFLDGYNAGGGNVSRLNSYQSIPLNKWVHIAAQTDMSTFLAGTTNSYVMIDGVDVPAVVSRSGTNPTALIQAGNLEVGSMNGGTNFFPGKIAQAFVTSAKVTQATIRSNYISQSISPTETSLISAYSFSNSINDLNTTNANNLTANGSAVATNSDSPFTQNSAGVPGGSLDYAIVTAVSASTITCQVPEGCTIPTSGGISAVSYSTQGVPFGFPKQRGRWRIQSIQRTQVTQGSAVVGTWYNVANTQLNVPSGDWQLGYSNSAGMTTSAASSIALGITLSTGASTNADLEYVKEGYATGFSAANGLFSPVNYETGRSLTVSTVYYLNISALQGSGSITLYTLEGSNASSPAIIYAEPAYL